MATIFGTQCARALYEVGVPFDAAVNSLVDQLGLTREEAVTAARSWPPSRDHVTADVARRQR